MIKKIPDTLIFSLIERVKVQLGLHFPKERSNCIERGIRSAAREFGFEDAQSCIQWLLSTPLAKNQIEILASHLTVGETYFFREQKSIEILERHILPELISSRQVSDKHLRIWSAGCATGEEPYSIAILVSKLIPDLKDWNITILATDINPRSLQKAENAVYTNWSFRDVPPETKEKYFRKTKGEHYEILPRFKKMVEFSYLNLAEDTYPSLVNKTNAMDVIFCRNVLMYFEHERAKKVIQQLYRSLVDGGLLIVSPTETSHVLYKQFVTVGFSGINLYKKDSNKTQIVEDSVTKGISYYPQIPLNPPFVKGDSGEFVSEHELEIDLLQSAEDANVEEGKVVGKDSGHSFVSTEASTVSDSYAEALALYEQGRYTEAEDKILGLVSYSRDNSKAVVLLGRIYANQGKLTEALEWCEKAVTVDKFNPICYYLYATILEEQDRIVEAVKSLKRALYLDQNFILAHFALGNLTRKQGKLKESKKYFENVFHLLSTYSQEDVLPESDGITAGRLSEIIQAML